MMHLFAEIFWTRKPVRSKTILLASALAVALSRSACGASADQPATLQLLPEAQVDSTGIFLHQIIITYDPSMALPQLRLASAPGLGQTARLSRSQITELVQKYEPSGLPTTNWSGALEVRVTRRTRQLVDSDMTQLLAATLQRESVKDKGELELQFTRPWIPVIVPDEPLTVKVIDLIHRSPGAGCCVMPTSPSSAMTCSFNAKLSSILPMPTARLNSRKIFPLDSPY